MDKCPSCGAKKKVNFENEFTCDSFYGVDIFVRSVDCCKRQLAAQAELIREMVDLLNYAGQTLTIAAALHHRPPDEHLMTIKTIINRPEVRAIMEAAVKEKS